MDKTHDNLKDLIEHEVLNFLRTRHHAEKPHVSVISPVPVNLWQPELCEKFGGDIEVEEDEDEGEDEDMFVYRYPGYIFGVDLLNAKVERGLIDVEFNFYVRTKYDYDDESKWDKSSYARIRIGAAISSSSITYRITASQLAQPEGYSKEVVQDKEGCVITSFLVVPIECTKLADLVNNPLKQYEKQIFNRLAATALPEGKVDTKKHIILCIGAGSATELEFVHIVPAGSRDYNLWKAIRAEVHDKQGKLVAYYYPSFGIIIGRCMQEGRSIIKAYLVNLGGVVKPLGGNSLDKELRRYCQRGVLYTYNPNEGGSRWALGLLLEVEGRLRATGGARLGIKWDAAHGGLMYAYTYNTMLIEEGPETYLLRDYALVEEELPAIKRNQLTVKEFFDGLISKLTVDQRCKETVAELLTYISEALRRMGIEKLYTYQEEVIEEVLASQGLIRKDGQVKRYIAVTARTAGGKTMAFLIPSIILSVYRRCREGQGVKAIFMYPTKALANDQLEEVAHLLYEIYRVAQTSGKPYESPTFGVLHGNIKFRDELADLPLPLPLRCPEHHTEVEFDGKHVVCRGSGQCEFAAFIEKHMKFMRDEIFGDPPDILVTDEDMVNRILSGADRRSPPKWFEWSIFGAGFKRCPTCGHVYPHIWSQKCRKCKADLVRVRHEKPSVPSLIVLDEAHMLTGSFGAQIHHMLSLLEYVLNRLAESADDYSITYVLSSATMGKTEEFAASLLGVSSSDIHVVKAELEEGRETMGRKRVFTFIMPKSYTVDATTTMAIWRLLKGIKEKTGATPKGIVFTNYLDQSNELLYSLRTDRKIRQLARVGGHSTDFDQDRVEVENKFKKGELDVLVATSTLEVGVDYGVVDFVVIHGMPATVTSFIQRIGRAGRNRDAVVLVVFDPERRIDYYFFENYRLLSSGADRELALEREIYPVGKDNEVALRRAVRRYIVASLKLCCSANCSNIPNVQKFVCNAVIGIREPNINKRVALWEGVVNVLKSASSLPRSLSIGGSIIIGELEKAIDDIKRNASSIIDIEDVVEILGGGDTLYNLRAADEYVEFSYNFLNTQRKRELRYAIKHALHGQITSFRGYFFATSSVDASAAKELKEFLKE
jgi:superfamily II DNA/RNA helicase